MISYKINLLISAWSKNKKTFIQQFVSLIKDKILGPTFLIYLLDKGVTKNVDVKLQDFFSLKSYSHWLDIEPSYREEIESKLKTEYWGKKEWFDLGWTFWIGTLKSQPAIVSWTRSNKQSADFFFPLGNDCALIWQTVTFVELRGQRLMTLMLHNIAYHLMKNGIEKIYGTCRDFNSPSTRAFSDAGFHFIGFGKKQRSKGYGIYYSTVQLFNRG